METVDLDPGRRFATDLNSGQYLLFGKIAVAGRMSAGRPRIGKIESLEKVVSGWLVIRQVRLGGNGIPAFLLRHYHPFKEFAEVTLVHVQRRLLIEFRLRY